MNNRIILIFVMLMLSASSLFAQGEPETPPAPIDPVQPGLLAPDFVPPVPPVVGGFTIDPGSLGGGSLPGDIAAPPGACDLAAGSYMTPGMQAVRNTIISFDDIVYNNQDEDLVLYALYAIEATQLFDSRNRFAAADNLTPVGPFSDGDVVIIGNASICVSTSLFTARLWELETGEWVIDTISVHEPLDVTNSWPADAPDPQTPGQSLTFPQFPVLVDGLVFRYLMPYIEPPVTTMPGADQVDTDLPVSNACEYAAPSYLAVGMDVILNGYGYERMPDFLLSPLNWTTWTFYETQFALSDHGMAAYIDVLNSTPLLNIPGNFEAVALPPAELLNNGTTFTTGTIVAGPFCSETSVAPPVDDGCSSTCSSLPCVPCTQGTGINRDPDRFYTWWDVEVTVNGQAYRGFYPENVGQYSHWLWATDGIFPRKLFLYYMIPDALAMQTQPETCRPTLFAAGQSVSPATGAVNLRSAPGGDVIGRVGAGQIISIFGEPICEDGVNWWQTNGGFVAETEPGSGASLLMPAIPAQPTDDSIESADTPVPTSPTRQPEPLSSPTPTIVPIQVTPVGPTEESTPLPPPMLPTATPGR